MATDITPDHSGAAALVLGPLLRYVGETEATIWVETDRPCNVEVLGHTAHTFEVAGHHYGLVIVTGLRPGTEYSYQVVLDEGARWPEPDSEFGPSAIRTLDPGRPQRLVFGSCRVAGSLPPSPHPDGANQSRDRGPDAMDALAHQLAGTPHESWPDLMLLIGDQIYADNPGQATRLFIEERRDPSVAPGYEVADFEEYCVLYREAWSTPAVRWLLSVVPTIMIFDDHDVHDDWNISAAWRSQFRTASWWRSRITGALASYWIYQHVGNLSPAELEKDDLWRRVQQSDDAASVLDDVALGADAQTSDIRWSVRRDSGGVRVVVIDSRSRRVLDDDRHRLMVDEAEWEWVTKSTAGDVDHLVLATSLPLLLPRGVHSLEAWNEAVCAGAWGTRFRSTAERLRRRGDLEHWAAFRASFTAFEDLLSNLARGSAGPAPKSITVISGDIHHSYLAAARLPDAARSGTAVYQAVCSPVHNLLEEKLRRVLRLVSSRLGTIITTAAASIAGAQAPRVRWRISKGPWFSNMLAELCYDGRQARIRFDRAVADPSGFPQLEPAYETPLTKA